MNIKAQPCDLPLTHADYSYIRSRVIFALTTSQQDIDNVRVSLFEISAAEAESIKHCRVDVQLLNGHSLIGDSRESDLHLAIHRAVDRAAWKVLRSLGRQSRDFDHSRSTGFRQDVGRAAAYGDYSF